MPERSESATWSTDRREGEALRIPLLSCCWAGDIFNKRKVFLIYMRAFDIQEVSFETVMARYREDNGAKNDWWEERNLKRANDKFGKWIKARIPVECVGELIMPHYNHGGTSITPEEGAPLSEAYAVFKKNREKFEKQNFQFCKRFESQKKLILKNGVKPVYLSQEPLLMGTSYSKLAQHKNRLTHLDGFHRLMALMGLNQKPEFIDCFIAVYPTFKPDQLL